MLKDYRKLAISLQNKFEEIQDWDEIEFDTDDRKALLKLDIIDKVYNHSIRTNSDSTKAIIPSQYILYAIAVKELSLAVFEFLDLFEKYKKKIANNSQTAKNILEKTIDYKLVDPSLDEYSKIIGPNIFYDEALNLKSKSIVDSKGLRGVSDFFKSVVIKPMGVPAVSSDALGKLIYSLCQNREVYSYFEKKYINKIPFIVKDSSLKDFIFLTINFLYNFDELSRIKEFLVPNSDPSNLSLNYEGRKLTTIFKKSSTLLNEEQLSQGGRKRYFESPVFNWGNEFYYLSTEWTDGTGSRLDLDNFKAIVNALYPEFELINNGDFIFKSKQLIESVERTIFNFNNSNKIYYGAPGTGKSYKVDKFIKDLDKKFYERITFHPEYDNASFVGCYKPVSIDVVKEEDGEKFIDYQIQYKFVPQAFTNIYKRAWQDLDNQYYLVIEEINRGNCAEIFGELFQLLDRNSGYTVAPSNELYKHLVEEFRDENHEGIAKGLKLPPNLAILATMNTSDQSLFPMDSAFKRRWEWEYVPICYDETFKNDKDEVEINKSFLYKIDLDNGSLYSWIKFIEYINLNHIKENPNLGMDKCIGNYFVKPEVGDSITLNQFINKVVFYLWNDVFKDEDNAVFEENSSYEDFFPTKSNGLKKVTELFERIGLEKLVKNSEDDSSIDLASEPQEPYGE